MKQYTREITKEIFDNAINGVILNEEDYDKVFNVAEVCGYGVYLPYVYKISDEKYIVRFELGDTCD